MGKIQRYTFKKGENIDKINITLNEHTSYECSYEYLENIFINLLTPKSLENESDKEKRFVREENCSDEEYVEKILSLLDEQKLNMAIKNLVLEDNILELECYNLDDATSNNSMIVIDRDLFSLENFNNFLFLITTLFNSNKESLFRDYNALKKQEQNKNLALDVIDNFLDNKQKELTQKEGIVVLSLLYRKLEDYIDYFDEEYRKCHSIKFMSCVPFPIIALATLLGKVLMPLSTVMSTYAFIASMAGGIFVDLKVWDRIIFANYNNLKNQLEQEYQISYDLDERKVVLNDPLTFYDAYTKCIKSTLELAYSKLTTPLDEEITRLYSLLSEYHNCNDNFEKAYFSISLLNIRKQIMLKESFIDKRNAISNDDVKFIEQYIKFLTGKSSKMLGDSEVDNIIEQIKQNEERRNPDYSISLMTKIVIHIYDTYLQGKDTDTKPKEVEPNIEYDLGITLGKKAWN